ncbi:MAG: hypothetical protein HQM14_07455 [SAR324 cluster bacterium]|nr:hypothetical protein [SAR324 cluster bacterium]
MLFRIVSFTIAVAAVVYSSLFAAPKQCTPEEIAKLARGGFTDQQINEFCIITETKENSLLREKYASLEGKNWKTHYYLSRSSKKREEIYFTVNKDNLLLTSTNPKVQYYEVEDLGDALRFKRKQSPYKAIYTITIPLEQISENQIPIVQQYKKVTNHTWTSN